MTERTPRPVSDDSSPEAPSQFCGDRDKEQNQFLAEYDQLCPSGLDEGAVEEDDEIRAAEQPTGSAVDIAAEATAAEEQEEKKKKIRRRKCYSRFTSKPKGKRNSAHAPVLPR